MGNLSEVDIFLWGFGVFYQTIHAAGMKEKRAKGIRGAKDFSPLRWESGFIRLITTQLRCVNIHHVAAARQHGASNKISSSMKI
jgi:hypothetical protein